MPSFIIGSFKVPGVPGPVIVEAPLAGVGKQDYANLLKEVLKLHPKVSPVDIRRLGSTIETREEAAQFINPYPGMTLRQLFIDNATADGSGAECFREIGTVFFEGAAQDVLLRYMQDKGTVGLTLKDRMTRNATRFSNQMNAGIPVEKLPELILEILGRDGRELALRLKSHASDQPIKPSAPKRKQQLAPVFTPPEHLPAPKAPKTPPAAKPAVKTPEPEAPAK
jgi:hypothetical protein